MRLYLVDKLVRKTHQLVALLLSEAQTTVDITEWPEFREMDEDEFWAYVDGLRTTYIEGEYYWADDGLHLLINQDPRQPSMRFETPEEYQDFLRDASIEGEDSGADYERHVYEPPKVPDVPKYSVEQKRAYLVYESGDFLFLKMPTDPTFIRREGIDMQHCLAWAHEDYCRRMVAKEIDVYSMIDSRDGAPRVDIEVALLKSSYSYNKIEKPTVTQIRGPRNEVPPKDEFIPALMDFFTHYGKDWALSGHGVQNFDGRIDGDLLVERWKQIQGEPP